MTSDFEEYRSIREEIWREHIQINSRMHWFLVFQTILISGVVFLLKHISLKYIATAIAVAGICLCYLAIKSIGAAKRKIREVLRPKEGLFRIGNNSEKNEGTEESFPRWHVASTDKIDKNGLLFPTYAPWTVCFLWGFILIFIWFPSLIGGISPSAAYQIASQELNTIYGKGNWSRMSFEFDEHDDMFVLWVKEIPSQEIIAVKLKPTSGQVIEIISESLN